MPTVRHYIVTQTRTVKVSANNELQAAVLATKELDGEEYTSEPGIRITEPVAVIELDIKKLGLSEL